MAFKLSSLLNPTSPSPQPQEQLTSNLAPVSSDINASLPSLKHVASSVATSSNDLDAAQALTAFATAPSYGQNGAQHSPMSHSQHSSPTLYQGAHPSNAYPPVAPVEPTQPSPSVLQHPVSPTLEQYHHKSKSPEEQRRESFAAANRNSPPTILAPLQNYPQKDHAQTVDYVPQHSGDMDCSRGLGLGLSESVQHNEADRQHNPLSDEEKASGIFKNELKDMKPAEQCRKMDSSAADSGSHSPSDQLRSESETANPVQIKEEHPGSEPNSAAPQSPEADALHKPSIDEDIDEETRKAIEKLRNDDLGLRRARGQTSDKIAQSIESAIPPVTGSLKKRPAPRTTAANKKGMAKKPPTKKRKTLDERNATDEAEKETTLAGPKLKANGNVKNGTKSKSATPARQNSPQTDHTHDEDDSDDEEEDGSDSGQLYCVCRKPDNHTWMIACDGCEDWFHGTCVQMTPADGELIAQYYCQSCFDAGKGRTMWKLMCRRKGCGKAAKMDKNSKYCSDSCGKSFFKELLAETRREQRAAEKGGEYAEKWRAKENEVKERRRLNRTDNNRNPLDSDSEDETKLSARGGVLRPGELKALVNASTSAQDFQALGDQLRSPPPSLSPEDATSSTSTKERNLDAYLLPSEADRKKAIEKEKDTVRERRALLKDREKFVAMTKDVISVHAEREGIKPKDLCGYDSRHAWSESEFKRWRESSPGRRAFELKSLDPAAGKQEEPDNMEVDGDESVSQSSVCHRKVCKRHGGWQKTAREDVLFEIQTCATIMRALDAEEKGIQERALDRYRKGHVPDQPAS